MAAAKPFIISRPTLLLFIAVYSTFCKSLSFNQTSSNEADGPSQQPPTATAYPPFKPTIAAIIAILSLFLCITFLLFLYAKHCKHQGNAGGQNGVVGYYFGGGSGVSQATNFPVCMRKNSGLDRLLVESLPVFRFSSLRGQKDGLECAVCLNRFEPAEVLRLLPKCKHAFHVECVDTWLDAHSTCPLCRYRVDPEDLLLAVDPDRHVEEGKSSVDSTRKSFVVEAIRRISGRHSYNGETAAVGWFERQFRKDGLLMTRSKGGGRKLEHRIIVSDKVGVGCRWSDVQPSDLLYLGSEMVTRSLSEVTGKKMATAAMIELRVQTERVGQ